MAAGRTQPHKKPLILPINGFSFHFPVTISSRTTRPLSINQPARNKPQQNIGNQSFAEASVQDKGKNSSDTGKQHRIQRHCMIPSQP